MKTVILAGGSGTRLWPLSRTYYPKQFLQIFNDRSLFQQTIGRNTSSEFMVVTNEAHYFLVNDQAAEIGTKNMRFILEPVGRNTAPAIALACMSMDESDILLITPSDHFIKDEKTYKQVIKQAQKFASDGFLVTFGIKPTFPATGYGYIEANGEDVKSFKEKPDITTAETYFNSDNYYWNSGMFMFSAKTFLSELRAYEPTLYEAARAAYNNRVASDNRMIRIPYDDMMNIPGNSIDYAVMERSTKVKVIPADMGWSDLGSFDELYKTIPQDSHQNAVIGEHIPIDSTQNLIIGQPGKLVSTIGVDDCMIIDTSDALLVTRKGASQRVKDLVQTIKKEFPEMATHHRTVHRPWGSYTILLEEKKKYKIKKIVVKPKHKLSLQKHFHRNEHWIVVKGTARINNGDRELLLKENESTYIPMGQVHRLENPGKIDLVMIEAQVGSYLGEDDIVRFDDEYKRI